jgi:hypothetical protein
MKYIFLSLVFLASLPALGASSIDTNKFWSEARVFVTSNGLASPPDDLNALTAGDSVQSLSRVTGFGLEGNFNVARFMKAGLRGGGRWTKEESTVATNTNAFLAVQQGWGGAIVRFPILREDLLQFDLFGEAGASVSRIDVSTQSNGSGTFTKSFNPYERAGSSFGLGWSTFFIFVEGGYQWERLEAMSYSGSLTNSISSIDLSGTYAAAGFIISGIPGFLAK